MADNRFSWISPHRAAALRAQAERDVARQAIWGAPLYVAIACLVGLATRYGSEHPWIVGWVAAVSAVLGASRLVLALRAAKAEDEDVMRWAGALRGLILAQAGVWGGFGAVTALLYGLRPVSMLVLLCTAALTAGVGSSLAPDRHLGRWCLGLLVGPAAVAAFWHPHPSSAWIGAFFLAYMSLMWMQAEVSASTYERISRNTALGAAQEGDKLFRAAFENVRCGVALVDQEGRFLHVNEWLSRTLERPREQWDELRLQDLPFVAPLTDSEPSWKSAFEGSAERVRVELRTDAAQRGEVWLQGALAVAGSAGADARHYVLVVDDVTEVKQAELELQRSQKRLNDAQRLESIGVLAGGVAHDFNNMLTVILGHAELALAKLEDDGRDQPAQEDVAAIAQAAGRASELTHQLLAFGRRQTLKPESVDINEVVRQSEALLSRSLGDRNRLFLDLDDDIDNIQVDAGQVQRVLLNLALNSRQAMPAGGSVTIRTRGTANPSGSDGVWLEFEDNGEGMDEATRSRAFEPFFTGRADAGGTGMGLASVYGIVQQSGGDATLESFPGRGTTVNIFLPRMVVSSAAAVPLERSAAHSAAEAGTVLIVDDDAAVREVISTSLRSRGFRTLEASSGEQALELVHARSGDLDLLVTDMMMPVMTGSELARRLGESYPGIPTLFLTAYGAHELASQGLEQPERILLTKPFTIDALTGKVESVLAAARR